MQLQSAASRFANALPEAVCEKLGVLSSSVKKPWMKSFGELRHLHKETARISQFIDGEFEHIDGP